MSHKGHGGALQRLARLHGAHNSSYFPGALERAMASASLSMPFTPKMGRLW
jgi:hypothetical protein